MENLAFLYLQSKVTEISATHHITSTWRQTADRWGAATSIPGTVHPAAFHIYKSLSLTQLKVYKPILLFLLRFIVTCMHHMGTDKMVMHNWQQVLWQQNIPTLDTLGNLWWLITVFMTVMPGVYVDSLQFSFSSCFCVEVQRFYTIL
jgi:hypothetical protein